MSVFVNKHNELLENNNFDELNTFIKNSDLSNEPYFINMIPELLNKLTDYKTSEQAKETSNLIIEKMNVFSMKIYMNILYENFTS